MGDIGNTQFLHNGGDAPSTPAASRNNEKPYTISKSKEVLKVMEKNKDINKAQQTPTPSSKKTAERRKKKDTSKTASTSARKKRKTNEKSAGRIGQTEVTKHVEKVIDKSKSKHKSIKKEVNKNSKHEKGEVPPAYSPQQFIGLYICKEHNGVKNLGTVLSYDPKTKLFKILFDNDKTNDMELDELLKSKATAKDIFEARQALQSSNSSKKTSNEEKKEATLSEEK